MALIDYVNIGVACLFFFYIVFASIRVMLKKYTWSMLGKDASRLVIVIAVYFVCIGVVALISAFTPILADSLKTMVFSNSYVALFGNTPAAVVWGVVMMIIVFWFAALWAINKLPYLIMPYTPEEKEYINKGIHEWNAKMPKWLRRKEIA